MKYKWEKDSPNKETCILRFNDNLYVRCYIDIDNYGEYFGIIDIVIDGINANKYMTDKYKTRKICQRETLSLVEGILRRFAHMFSSVVSDNYP